ncbi:hypothetical protein EDD86DRAFT_273340 [Gorgonomyces haynaldii]|nr:hypothetical protein EDD86DRAFT_273340 [Gorgonomyces haynaldii]
MLPFTPMQVPGVSLMGQSPASNIRLVYNGGPVISHVEVKPLFFGTNVAFQNDIIQFYSTIVDSPYMDWLVEYNTPTQRIGRGTYGGALVVAIGTKTAFDDVNDVQSILKILADNKQIVPSANTYFPIHFGPGAVITSGGAKSCETYCGYHGAIPYKDTFIYYGVLPDMTVGGCTKGCGNSGPFPNTCAIAAHEMIEAITNPQANLATGNSPPLSWYDNVNGEIGDVCLGQHDTVTGANGKSYTVQKEWSNNKNQCITTIPGTPVAPKNN